MGVQLDSVCVRGRSLPPAMAHMLLIQCVSVDVYICTIRVQCVGVDVYICTIRIQCVSVDVYICTIRIQCVSVDVYMYNQGTVC